MKHYLPIVLLCGAGTFSAFAQTVVVTEADGTSHKFFAEDVKEISFEARETHDFIEYSSVDVANYSHNVVLDFKAEGKPSIALDVYTGDATYLKAGDYAIAAGGTDMVIVNSSLQYTYVEIDGTKHKINEGKMTVANELNDYTITMDFVLDDASEFKARFKGELSDAQQYVSLTAVNAQQIDINDPVSGEFYLRLNDAAWLFEMVLDFYNAPGATVLAPGTYTLSDSKDAGTYGSRSDVQFYSPVNETVKITTPVKVEADGTKTRITVEAELKDGRHYTIVFDDEVKYLDQPQPTVPSYDLENVDDINVWTASRGYAGMTFIGPEAEVRVEFYGAEGKPYLAEGLYTVSSVAGEYTVMIGTGSETKVMVDEQESDVLSGTMNVSYEGKEAVVEFDFVLQNGTPFQAEFRGEIDKFSKYVSIVADVMKQADVNNPKDGEIYLKYNDSDWTFEGVFDFICAPGSTSVTPGTYTLSSDNAAGTYTSSTKITTYSPYEDIAVTAPVTVARNGQMTMISFTQTMADGRVIEFRYSGKAEYLNEDPEADEPLTYTFDRATMESFGLEREVHFFAGSDVEVSLNFVNSTRADGIDTGTYPVDNSGGLGTVTTNNYTWANIGGVETPIVSGEVNVENIAGNYTVTLEVELENGMAMKGTYTGAITE